MKLASKAFDHCFQENGSRGGFHYFFKSRKIHFNEGVLKLYPLSFFCLASAIPSHDISVLRSQMP